MFEAVLKPGVFKHVTCRNNIYPRSKVQRCHVPDDLVYWSVPYATYSPPNYTAPHVHGQIWADADIAQTNINFKPKWNALDGNINRASYNGQYEVCNNYPRNPIGRTGLCGRGLLGRWGPNHAADPVVTRWKRDQYNHIVKSTDQANRGILQMIAIQRRDNGMWAIPGGMVDAGERVSETLRREFTEEALNSSEIAADILDKFFKEGVDIYKGYVDDYRNTDNAWMETMACNFHDETGNQVGQLKLIAGDDAALVKWLDIDKHLQLHANHLDIIEQVVKRLNAHW